MWMPKGKAERVEIPAPGTNRKFPIYDALNYRTNRISYRLGEGKNATEFLGFLAQLAAEYRHRRCILVLDNASYHTAAVVQRYLDELTDRFQVIWLPPYSPELNDIEHIWKYAKGSALANYDFGGVSSLREAVKKVFEDLNNSDDDILSLKYRDPLTKKLLQVA